MKLCICFLVVACSAVSSEEGETVSSPTLAYTTQGDQFEAEVAQTMAPSPPSQTNASVSTVAPVAVESKQDEKGSNETEAANTTVIQETTTVSERGATTLMPSGVDVTASSTVTATTSKPDCLWRRKKKTVTIKEAGSSWGYVILVLIILVIIILCVILYFLRRVSRRPSPVSRLNEPTGTFEPVYLDDLDRPAPDQVTADELSTPQVANGTSLPSEEKASSGESAPQEQSDANGLETSPVSDSSPSACDDSTDKAPTPSTSTNLLLDGIGEEQKNENNNNPFVCSSGPFVEINLDEPALCDQLLTSPQATSSVLPFSFSLTSSSS
ncbi:uncharacterized protein [Channa argus]|uniref:uncharacterized protein isoform X2 n=1 Tax=Channa argus TaxID=215402 RepID=UPI003520A2AB